MSSPHTPHLHTALLIASVLLTLSCSKSKAAHESLEPNEHLPGGDTTNQLLLGSNAFIKPASNLSPEHSQAFFSGNSFFNQNWVQAPSSTDSRDGLGPFFNARSCSNCHFKDGRGQPSESLTSPHPGLLARLSIPPTNPANSPQPHPIYGSQLQDLSLPDLPPEGTLRITYTEEPGQYPDGTPFTLLRPTYAIENLSDGPIPDDLMLSPRVAPHMIGLGLLEAIPTERLKQLADDDDANNDGISGRIHEVPDLVNDTVSPGRFGWKAEQPSVRQQVAAAFSGDLGITSTLFPNENCTAHSDLCNSIPTGGTPELSPHLLNSTTLYSQALAVPIRRNYKTPQALRGRSLFYTVGCDSCHTPSHTTGPFPELPEMANQRIWPYTDLLLHDMGPGLSDNRPSLDAQPTEWKTPPLWGIGLLPNVNQHQRLLHDGRARGVEEAILWHGGEAQTSRELFTQLPKDDRDALIAFINTL